MYIIFQIFQMSLVPATGYGYGVPARLNGKVICNVYNPNDNEDYSGESLGIMKFSCIFIFFIIMTCFVVYDITLITRYLSSLRPGSEYFEKVKVLRDKAWLYPIFMLIVWIPVTIHVMVRSFESDDY
jgi:hypothetical protein